MGEKDRNEEVELNFENLTQEEMDFIAGAGDVEGEFVVTMSVASIISYSIGASLGIVSKNKKCLG